MRWMGFWIATFIGVVSGAFLGGMIHADIAFLGGFAGFFFGSYVGLWITVIDGTVRWRRLQREMARHPGGPALRSFAAKEAKLPTSMEGKSGYRTSAKETERAEKDASSGGRIAADGSGPQQEEEEVTGTINLHLEEELVAVSDLQAEEESEETVDLQVEEELVAVPDLQAEEESEETVDLQVEEEIGDVPALQAEEESEETVDLQVEEEIVEVPALQAEEESEETVALQVEEEFCEVPALGVREERPLRDEVRPKEEIVLEHHSRWHRILRPLLYENFLIFIGAFLTIAGSVFGVVSNWDRVGSEWRPVLVLGSMALYTHLFFLSGYLLARKERLHRLALSILTVPVLLLPFLYMGIGSVLISHWVVGLAFFAVLLALDLPCLFVVGGLHHRSTGRLFGIAFWILCGFQVLVAWAGESGGPPSILVALAGFALLYGWVLRPFVTRELGEILIGSARGAWFFVGSLLFAFSSLLGQLYFQQLRSGVAPDITAIGLFSVLFCWVALDVHLVLAGHPERSRHGELWRYLALGGALSAIAVAGGGRLAGDLEPWVLAATALIGAALWIRAQMAQPNRLHLWGALVLSLVAYDLSPGLVSELARAIVRGVASTAGYEGRPLPLAYYALTFVPYLVGLGWISLVHRRRKKTAWLPILTWVVAVAAVGLFLSFSHPLDRRPALGASVAYGLLALLAHGYFRWRGFLTAWAFLAPVASDLALVVGGAGWSWRAGSLALFAAGYGGFALRFGRRPVDAGRRGATAERGDRESALARGDEQSQGNWSWIFGDLPRLAAVVGEVGILLSLVCLILGLESWPVWVGCLFLLGAASGLWGTARLYRSRWLAFGAVAAIFLLLGQVAELLVVKLAWAGACWGGVGLLFLAAWYGMDRWGNRRRVPEGPAILGRWPRWMVARDERTLWNSSLALAAGGGLFMALWLTWMGQPAGIAGVAAWGSVAVLGLGLLWPWPGLSPGWISVLAQFTFLRLVGKGLNWPMEWFFPALALLCLTWWVAGRFCLVGGGRGAVREGSGRERAGWLLVRAAGLLGLLLVFHDVAGRLDGSWPVSAWNGGAPWAGGLEILWLGLLAVVLGRSAGGQPSRILGLASAYSLGMLLVRGLELVAGPILGRLGAAGWIQESLVSGRWGQSGLGLALGAAALLVFSWVTRKGGAAGWKRLRFWPGSQVFGVDLLRGWRWPFQVVGESALWVSLAFCMMAGSSAVGGSWELPTGLGCVSMVLTGLVLLFWTLSSPWPHSGFLGWFFLGVSGYSIVFGGAKMADPGWPLALTAAALTLLALLFASGLLPRLTGARWRNSVLAVPARILGLLALALAVAGIDPVKAWAMVLQSRDSGLWELWLDAAVPVALLGSGLLFLQLRFSSVSGFWPVGGWLLAAWGTIFALQGLVLMAVEMPAPRVLGFGLSFVAGLALLLVASFFPVARSSFVGWLAGGSEVRRACRSSGALLLPVALAGAGLLGWAAVSVGGKLLMEMAPEVMAARRSLLWFGWIGVGLALAGCLVVAERRVRWGIGLAGFSVSVAVAAGALGMLLGLPAPWIGLGIAAITILAWDLTSAKSWLGRKNWDLWLVPDRPKVSGAAEAGVIWALLWGLSLATLSVRSLAMPLAWAVLAFATLAAAGRYKKPALVLGVAFCGTLALDLALVWFGLNYPSGRPEAAILPFFALVSLGIAESLAPVTGRATRLVASWDQEREPDAKSPRWRRLIRLLAASRKPLALSVGLSKILVLLEIALAAVLLQSRATWLESSLLAAVMAGLAAGWLVRGVRRCRIRLLHQGFAGVMAALLLLRWCGPLTGFSLLQDSLFWTGAGFLLLGCWRMRIGGETLQRPLLYWLIAAPAGVLLPWGIETPGIELGAPIVLAGALYLAAAYETGQRRYHYLSALFLNGGLILLFAQSGFGHPSFYFLPLGLTLLLLVELEEQRLDRGTKFRLQNLGIAIVCSSAAYEAVAVGGLWPFLWALLLCLAGIFLGLVLRVRAFLLCSTAMLVALVLGQLGRATLQMALPLWFLLTSVGVVILALTVAASSRREEILAWYRLMSEDFESWE